MGANAAVKIALYEAISGLGLTTYTANPQLADGGSDVDYPHVQIGVIAVSRSDTHTEAGFDFTARIHTRWRGGSEMPGLVMQDAIYDRLHNGSVDIAGYSLILLERQMSATTPLDGSFSGVCEYHALITEA